MAIWTVRPDGSQQQKVFEQDNLASPRWSPAGDTLYFLFSSPGNTQDLLKASIDPKSGKAKPPSLLLGGLQTGDYLTVSADGTRLAYSRAQHYSNLWLAGPTVPGGKEAGTGPQATPLTTGTSTFDSPSISPDGRWVAYVTAGHICKMPIEGGKPTQLTFSNGVDSSPAWSPDDGKRIAFGSNEGGAYRVWIVDADGGNRRPFAKTHLDEEIDSQLAWSPGPDIIYQTPGNQNFNILDAETGAEKPLIQTGPGPPYYAEGWLFKPQYSRDGTKIAVFWNRKPQAGLWVISLIDHSQTLRHAGQCYPAGWSPDGSSIYTYCGSDIAVGTRRPGRSWWRAHHFLSSGRHRCR